MDDKLAEQVRAALVGVSPVREVKMFGGIGFMLSGNLLVAVSDRGLLVRVGEEREPEALSRPGAQPMIMGGRTMVGYIRVEPAALDGRTVKSWLRLARVFVETLPAKNTAAKKSRRKRSTARASDSVAATRRTSRGPSLS